MLVDSGAVDGSRAPRAVRWLQPRNAAAAAAAILPLCYVAASVTAAFAVLSRLRGNIDTAGLLLVVIGAAAVVFVGWSLRYLSETHWLGWASLPFLCVAFVIAFDLLSRDRSVAAQVFFFFPALYAAARLPQAGAAIVTAWAVAGETLVAFRLLPPDLAFTDASYVSAAMITTVVMLSRAMAEQHRLVVKLRRQAAIDPLTGLVTRRVLDQAAQSALSGAASASGTALVLLDVDDFKVINDQYGHPTGDEVLVQLSALLVRGCRPSDVVARLGGDEIVLLLPGCSQAALLSRADTIVAAVREHEFLSPDGTPIPVSVTAGLAHAPTHALDLKSLYVTADTALYRAKRLGKDRVGEPGAPAGRPDDRLPTSKTLAGLLESDS